MKRLFADGGTGSAPLGESRFSFLNVRDRSAYAVLSHFLDDGTVVTHAIPVAAGGAASVTTGTVRARLGSQHGGFATIVESDLDLLIDKLQGWNDATGEGANLETAVDAPATTWLFAEGATHSGFSLRYQILNPAEARSDIEVTYLRPAPAPALTRSLSVPPLSRVTVDAAGEQFESMTPLASTDVSTAIKVVGGAPVVAERTMYFALHGSTASAGAVAPATRWHFAEGATGAYFDLFLLLVNFEAQAAEVEVRYLLPSGEHEVRTYAVDPRSRFTVWVDHEGDRLADTSVAMIVESTNGVPVVAERSMYWGGFPYWREAHNVHGAIQAGTSWAFAGGDLSEDGGRNETYVLVANTAPVTGLVRVTLVAEGNGDTRVSREWHLAPMSRFTLPVGDEFPELRARRFGGVVESLATADGAEPAPIVVERAVYGPAPFTWGWQRGGAALAVRFK